MHRLPLLAGLLALTAMALLPRPAGAANANQKTATCKFYADQQKLAGVKRTQFMAKCTSSKNEPRGPAAGASGSVPAPEEPEQQ